MELRIEGVVVEGNKLGRTMGFPTANVIVGDDLQTPNGAYAATVEVDGRTYDAVANIGVKPTISKASGRTLEAHLFDFGGDLYGKRITVTLRRFIRPEMRFDSMDQLKAQIESDAQKAKQNR